MFLSQQGLNKAVTALEDELGVQLVERTHRGVELTAAGRVLSVCLLVEFTHGERAALFDSYGFHVARRDAQMPTDGLHFTPLATPDATAQLGFLYRKDARPNARCRHYLGLVKRVLTEGNADYIKRRRELTGRFAL